ncbi:SDR family NAD(P)-dependent oxidoreductase [Sporobolomyces koalae]|uniref:SDR family NAD(P)-dependent oxidoreductase n=1 Tax=Sporobolomyces koalae TaxID=500713 RepID=UPI00316D7094
MASAHLLAAKLFNVKGLVAVVTGGGSGIGLMATQALAANGARVYITGRRSEYLATVVEKFGNEVEGEIIAMPGDVTNKEDVIRLAKEIGEREGGIHILVNNAGIAGERTKLDGLDTPQAFSEAHLKEQTYAGWDDVFRTNATSGFMTAMAFLPLLAKFTRGGDAAGKAIFDDYRTGIINITSISGLIKKSQNHFAYNASKAAANHLQRMLATEVGAKFGIRVNSIAPGVFPSEMTGSGSDEKNKTSLENQFDPKSLGVPAERAGTEEDMAGTILYLCSRAGQYTDGTITPVDGGTLSTNPSTY